MSESVTKLLEDYKADFEKDQDVDQLILMNKLESLAQITHKWLYRSFTHKQELSALEIRKEEMYAQLLAELELSDDPRLRGLSQAALKRRIDGSGTIRKINRQIKEKGLVINYLDEVVSICKFILPKMCENIIKLRDLEART